MKTPQLLAITLTTATIIGCHSVTEKNEESGTRNPVIKEKWHWDQESKQNDSAGYAQVVKVGNTLYISGVPTNDISQQGVERLYKTLEKCLNAYGATPKNVVKENLYTTDIEEMKKHNDARRAFYQGDFPAATWVQISRLYEAQAKIEVDLVAVIVEEK